MDPQPVQLTRNGLLGQHRTSTIWEVPSFDPGSVRGVYLHIPFCFHKCHYCDFYSIVDESRHEAFVARLIEEIRAAGAALPTGLETVFVGGGTPTLLPPPLWVRLIAVVQESLSLAGDVEFSVEANPETVTAELLQVLAAGGVNRISIGAQTFNPGHLQTLERWHDPVSVTRAVALARDAGIDNINLDLICAIPGQTLDNVRCDLDRAIALDPAHLSVYTLTYEPNTPLRHRLDVGAVKRVDEDTETSMYCEVQRLLASAGFEQYEISNWSRPGRRCRHNLLYWHNQSWWPCGPAACGHVDGVRWRNVPRLSDYLRPGPWPMVCDVEQLDEESRVGEVLMMRLRVLDGIPRNELEALLSKDRRGRWCVLESAVDRGLLRWRDESLVLTGEGLLVADTLIAELL